jgi:hypothetical protein
VPPSPHRGLSRTLVSTGKYLSVLPGHGEREGVFYHISMWATSAPILPPSDDLDRRDTYLGLHHSYISRKLFGSKKFQSSPKLLSENPPPRAEVDGDPAPRSPSNNIRGGCSDGGRREIPGVIDRGSSVRSPLPCDVIFGNFSAWAVNASLDMRVDHLLSYRTCGEVK